MLRLAIVESALELVPKELLNDASVINHAKRLGRKPQDTLLDKSYHYNAMKRLKDAYKRGRPDILHISLLAITSTPLYRKGLVELYVHTVNDEVITLKNVRLPKTYLRFEGLIVDLFKKRSIKADGMIMEVSDMSFSELIDYTDSKHVIGLSRRGKASNAEEIARLALKDYTMIVIGGFPKGCFKDSIMNRVNELYSISRYGLETHVVAARIVYEVEIAIDNL